MNLKGTKGSWSDSRMNSFSMPHLSKYIFYEDGTIKSRYNLKPVMCKKCSGKPKYKLRNDRGEQDHVFVKEIQLYGKHLKATTYETPRQVIDRILYPEKLKPTRQLNIKRMHTLCNNS